MAAKPLLYLIDGSSQMYRAYHAPVRTGEGSLLRNASGAPTNAVYIFVTMLRKLLKEHAPAYIAASFDLPGRTFRDDLAADYKAHRAPMPDDLASQIPLVHRACEALGVPIITHDRYEADDVIGTLAMRGAAEGYSIVIVTGDKDFFQLVSDDIRVFNPRDDGTWYDAAGVKDKFGVAPNQVVDVLALMGDTIDNVKGVPGIGEKGARELITAYGSLDALLEHAADVKQKKYREALLAHAAEAHASRELVRIHTNVPVPFDIGAFRFRGPSQAACYQLFSELGFRSLVMEFAPTADTTAKAYRLVTTSEELAALVEELAAGGTIRVPRVRRRVRRRHVHDCRHRRRTGRTRTHHRADRALSAAPPPGHAQRPATDRGRRAPGAAPAVRRSRDRKGRTRSQDRRRRPRPSRGDAQWPRPRHHARELSARRGPVRTLARNRFPRASELQSRDGRGRVREGRQGDGIRGHAAGGGAHVRLRARGPRATAGGPSVDDSRGRAPGGGVSRPRAPADSGARRRWSAPASGSTARRSRRSRSGSSASCPRAARRSSSSPASSSTSGHRSSSPAFSSRSCSCRRSSAT